MRCRHLAVSLLLTTLLPAAEPSMDHMWGEQGVKLSPANAERGQLLREGHYAMFIHWGLYSTLANQWQGKTYYGIGEWIMNRSMAGISASNYMTLAKNFNPVSFDAKAVAKLAKDAGMKYIVITSKHHEGFAMFHSKVDSFNIVEATPFKRDPMKELAAACREVGIGFGFYYSHFQDWTAPGGGGGPKNDADDKPATFEQYFRRKCLPQVEEITTNYGPIEIVWFDTPGSLEKKYAEELVATVRKNQPKALVSGRVGHNLGDYQTLGDMEVPLKKVPGLWESVDTTNDSWAFAWYDENWKGPKTILARLLATNARGGTYMLNIGLKGDGSIPKAESHLRKAGAWIARHPQVVYGTAPSPWDRAQPWGDVVARDNVLYLCVFDWPRDGVLRLHGLDTPITRVEILNGAAVVPATATKTGAWTTITVPAQRPDPLVSIIRVICATKPAVTQGFGLEPASSLTMAADFATASNVTCNSVSWMEKFGEWKTQVFARDWKAKSSVTWECDVMEPGVWRVDLSYAGKGRTTWKVVSDEGVAIQNNQNGSAIVQRFPIGEMTFTKAGKHTLTVSLLDGDPKESKLATMHLVLNE
jgi:alpha-L-fucosidase